MKYGWITRIIQILIDWVFNEVEKSLKKGIFEFFGWRFMSVSSCYQKIHDIIRRNHGHFIMTKFFFKQCQEAFVIYNGVFLNSSDGISGKFLWLLRFSWWSPLFWIDCFFCPNKSDNEIIIHFFNNFQKTFCLIFKGRILDMPIVSAVVLIKTRFYTIKTLE